MIGARQGKTGRRHLFAEEAGVVPQALSQTVALAQQIKHADGSGNDCRRQRIREEIGTRALAQPFDDLGASGGIATGSAAQRLAQRAGNNVDAIHDVAIFMRAATGRADKAHRMGVIYHHQRIELVGEIADAAQVGDHPVHREDAVGGDKNMARAFLPRLNQTGAQRLHIVIGVAIALRLAEPYAVDNRSVIERVGNNRVFRVEQRFKQAAVGIEAGGIENGILHAEKRRQLFLQLLMRVLRAADKAHRCHAETVRFHALFRRLNQRRMVCQA